MDTNEATSIRWYTACKSTNARVSKNQGMDKRTENLHELYGKQVAQVVELRGITTGRHQVCGENKIVESVSHIRGTCPKTELLRNAAHHKIRSTLAILSREKKLELPTRRDLYYQAVIDSEARNRRADIVFIDSKKNRGFVFDPTIRWETNVSTRDEDINIYVPCIPSLRQRDIKLTIGK